MYKYLYICYKHTILYHKLEALLIYNHRDASIWFLFSGQAMAHKLAVRYSRSHNASHNVISECISLPEILCLYFKQHSFHTTAVQFKRY